MPGDRGGAATKRADLYRMVMKDHVCPFGLKAKALLERKGFQVEDHWLETREQTDAFQEKHSVDTTPQVFIDNERVGGYDDLRRYFGQRELKCACAGGDSNVPLGFVSLTENIMMMVMGVWMPLRMYVLG